MTFKHQGFNIVSAYRYNPLVGVVRVGVDGVDLDGVDGVDRTGADGVDRVGVDGVDRVGVVLVGDVVGVDRVGEVVLVGVVGVGEVVLSGVDSDGEVVLSGVLTGADSFSKAGDVVYRGFVDVRSSFTSVSGVRSVLMFSSFTGLFSDSSIGSGVRAFGSLRSVSFPACPISSFTFGFSSRTGLSTNPSVGSTTTGSGIGSMFKCELSKIHPFKSRPVIPCCSHLLCAAIRRSFGISFNVLCTLGKERSVKDAVFLPGA